MNTLLVTHSNCSDGTLAAVLYCQKNPNMVNFIMPVVHGEYENLHKKLEEGNYKRVVFLDIYPKQAMLDCIKDDIPVEVYDHHMISEEIVMKDNYTIVHDKSRCAARIMADDYSHFVIDAVDARDRNVPDEKNQKLSNGIYALTARLGVALDMKNVSHVAYFNNLGALLYSAPYDICMSIGEDMAYKRNLECERVIAKSGRLANLNGMPILIVDANYNLRTDIGNYYFSNNANDVNLILFTMRDAIDANKVSVSGRGRAASDVNIPELFRQYDTTAGGHRYAGGMTVTVDLFTQITGVSPFVV